MCRWTVRIPRWMLFVWVTGGCIGAGGPQQTSTPVAAPAVSERAVINRYCVGCHNSKLKTGGFAVDTISAESPSKHPDEWEKVIRKLRARYMPPAGLPRPDERTYDSLIASLENSIDTAAAAKPNPGRTDTFRRLNRTEYRNAIRD